MRSARRCAFPQVSALWEHITPPLDRAGWSETATKTATTDGCLPLLAPNGWRARLGDSAVSEDVDADDVDLTSRITEERAEADEDPGVGVFASGAGLVPVGVGDDEEEVLGVGRDVGLPEVLEVVVCLLYTSPSPRD